MNTHHYYPQLFWKKAEQEALDVTPSNIQSNMTPILIMPDIDYDFIDQKYKKNLVNHLKDFGVNLSTSWHIDTPVMLDVELLEKHSLPNQHPLDICIGQADAYNKNIIPLIQSNSSSNYLASVNQHLSYGVAIKIKLQEIQSLLAIASKLQTDHKNIDVILDLEHINQINNQLDQTVLSCLAYIESIANWRSIILASTSYPSSQAGIPQNQVYRTPRLGWHLWANIIQMNTLPRTPGYSDYPVSDASADIVDPRFMNPYASARYSDFSNWIFVKGKSVKGNGWGQLKILCDILRNDQSFQGRQYSWGDEFIDDVANGSKPTGGPKEWRKVAHNHHFMMVFDQLSQFSSKHPVHP
jgi:hypothetical protein